MLWEREKTKPGDIIFFPHAQAGLIHLSGQKPEIESNWSARGGKAALRLPDVTNDGREDLFVVGLYGGANGVITSDSSIEGFHGLGGSGWTGI